MISDTPMQRFSQALYQTTGQQVQQTGENEMVCCPAHEDRAPSLSVGVGDDGKVLLNCFAGCSIQVICQSLGLTLADLMPAGGSRATVASELNDAEAEKRHAVYSAWLDSLPMDDQHRQNLRNRGLTDEQIDRRGYRTRRGFAIELEKKFPVDVLLSVPGFYLKENIKIVEFVANSGLLIPVRDVKGRIVGLKIRADRPGKKGPKYFWASSKKFGGPSPGVLPHVPLDVAGPLEVVRITEGPLKADITMELSGLPTIAFSGVSSWKTILPVLGSLQVKTVHLAFDADFRTNKSVAGKLAECAQELIATGYSVVLESWDVGDGKGIDDLLAAGKSPDQTTGDAVLEVVGDNAKRLGVGATDRVEVVISTDEYLTNDAAVRALHSAESLFVWLGELAQVVIAHDPRDGIQREDTAPKVKPVSLAALREELTRVCAFVKLSESEGEAEFKPAHPPAWCVSAVQARGRWPGVRPLTGVVTSPVLRPDGTILAQPGYDWITGLLYHPTSTKSVEVPKRPSRDDALKAVAKLRKLVCDFPFAEVVHEIGYLAALLTPLARYAIQGPAPLFLLDANTRGSGKSLLADLLGLIVGGMVMPRFSNPRDDDECRKRITALALAGDSLCLIDNIVGQLGCPSLDAALTAVGWKDRILGESRIVECPLNITWFATGNNVVLGMDTPRRVLPIRLESPAERPEDRDNFQHPNIIAHVQENRADYLAAGLTILAAYFASGRPDMKLPAWGSYEAWSSVVRSALVWLGLPDPILARREIVESSDRTAETLRLILSAWAELDPDCHGLTTAAAIKLLKASPDRYADAREKLLEACPPKGNSEYPTAQALGYRLRAIKRRICGGLYLDCESGHGNIKKWRVRPASTLKPESGGDGGDGGHRSRPNEEESQFSQAKPAEETEIQSATGGDHHPHRPHDTRDDGDWGEI